VLSKAAIPALLFYRRLLRYEAPFVRAVELLGVRAPTQPSSDLVGCVEGAQNLLHEGATVDEAVW